MTIYDAISLRNCFRSREGHYGMAVVQHLWTVS